MWQISLIKCTRNQLDSDELSPWLSSESQTKTWLTWFVFEFVSKYKLVVGPFRFFYPFYKRHIVSIWFWRFRNVVEMQYLFILSYEAISFKYKIFLIFWSTIGECSSLTFFMLIKILICMVKCLINIFYL